VLATTSSPVPTSWLPWQDLTSAPGRPAGKPGACRRSSPVPFCMPRN